MIRTRSRMCGFALLVLLVSAPAALAQRVTFADTGVPHILLSSGTSFYIGYSSGKIAGFPQRWAAIPFRIDPTLYPNGGWITDIDVHWFIVTGNEGARVRFVIWRRTGQNAPSCGALTTDPVTGDEVPTGGDVFSTGVLGPYEPGVSDPRLVPPSNPDDVLHHYRHLCIPIPEGNYYFTIYSAGFAPSNASGLSNAAWLGGGELQDPALEQAFMWRSVTQCSPGFQQYAPDTIQPTPGQDPNDRWNACFALFGYATPADCNTNGQNDFCELAYADCNSNNIDDRCDIGISHISSDCNSNLIPDDCEPANGDDCNTNTTNDICETTIFQDCNTNADMDRCDILVFQSSGDCNTNLVPDECEPDCNTNGRADVCDLADASDVDCNNDTVPDFCQRFDYAAMIDHDCNTNSTLDSCESFADCNNNGTSDVCDTFVYAAGRNNDCNTNNIPDDCDIASATAADCNFNGVPDNCDIAGEDVVDQFYAVPVSSAQDAFYTTLPSDEQGAPQVPPSVITVTAGDFRLQQSTTFKRLIFGGGYLAAGVALIPQERFTIRFWTNVNNRPGVVEVNVPDVATAGTIVRSELFAPADNQNYVYTVNFTTAITLPAGDHWFEAFMRADATEQNDWNLLGLSGNSTTGRGTMVVAVEIPELWQYNWIIGTAPGFPTHVALSLVRLHADANLDGIPDECAGCPGNCRGDMNASGAVDGTDIRLFIQRLYTGAGNNCADMNSDGSVNGTDVPLFVNKELTGTCP